MATVMGFRNNTKKIIDLINLNNFAILLHDAKTIRTFQEKSGMSGQYRVEYQHHYINAIGRIEAGDQMMDIAIPLVMYNYPQEVAGASVEFSLQDVSNMNNKAMKLAEEKFNELSDTEIMKKLLEMGVVTWRIEGLNSIHAHPSGVNRFSGTDLRADINHPGINFPCNIGENAANFASIIQHRAGSHAEIIHTEYRVFNATEESDKVYQKGRCLTLVRGYNPPPPEPIPEIEDGPIDKIFGTSRPKPKPKPVEMSRESYILKDQLTAQEGDDIAKDIMELWEKSDFQIDTSFIKRENVLFTRNRFTQNKTKHIFGQVNVAQKINEALFPSDEKKNLAKAKREEIEEIGEIDEDRLDNLDYITAVNVALGGEALSEKKRDVWIDMIKMKAEELEYYLSIDREKISNMSAFQVRELHEEFEDEILSEKLERSGVTTISGGDFDPYDVQNDYLQDLSIEEIVEMLLTDQIISKKELAGMTSPQIRKLAIEQYSLGD